MHEITVFMSYSHDSNAHRERVLRFSERLREDGIATILDQYVEKGAPPEGWPRWMMDGLNRASHVLCICTEIYHRRFLGQEIPGKGKGVDWEGALVTQALHEARSRGNRFIPVLFAASDVVCIPEPLRQTTHYLLDSEENYRALYDALLGQSGYEPGAIGELKRKQRRLGKPLRFAGNASTSTKGHRNQDFRRRPIDILRILKYAPENLIGREAELKILDEAWNKVRNQESPRAHVLSFIALGGEGKTSLVAKWAAHLASEDWPGCDAVFAWSFYSQGTQVQSTASADLFLREALRFFGDPEFADSPSSAFDKGRRLAQRVAEQRALLILDGLEPLQYRPSSPMAGECKDPGLGILLKDLAAHNRGLTIVTSRYSLVELKAFRQGTAPEIKLSRLSLEAGIHLLESLGVKGTRKEFEDLVEKVQGHALTLNLLGTWLRDAYGGDIRKSDRVKFEEADAEVQGGHAFRAMDAYVYWFESAGDKGAKALSLLSLMGLFDRPAERGCIEALFKEPAIPQLTESLIGLNEAQRNLLFKNLKDARLLSINRDTARTLVSLDAHPLLREYFAVRLKKESPEAARAAHHRLYEHLCATTPHKDKATLEDLQPLYHAVAHGCAAGMHQEACEKLYRDRILRGTGFDGFYSTRKLGAFGADLGAVACFFDECWSRVSNLLTESDQAWLVSVAGFSLRGLGRLGEALEPMHSGLEMVVKQEDWKSAAVSANNLSELELTLGDLTQARAQAEDSVRHAERSGDTFERMSDRTTHADALHQCGRSTEAQALFGEAEKLQAERQPEYPLLSSLPGFRYCDLLLASAEHAAWQVLIDADFATRTADLLEACRSVSERAQQTLYWWQNVFANVGILTIALEHLTLACAALVRKNLSCAAS